MKDFQDDGSDYTAAAICQGIWFDSGEERRHHLHAWSGSACSVCRV